MRPGRAAARSPGLTPEQVERAHHRSSAAASAARADAATSSAEAVRRRAKAAERAGEGGVDARGRHARRLLPAGVRCNRAARPRSTTRACRPAWRPRASSASRS
ncbi:MAG: hypothetical protein MZV65_29355 [Chromatiales bacterium]|nr:hypothetical protein [Chromatiales bacterium]